MAIPILNHMDFQKSGEIRNVRLHNQAASGVTSPGTGQIVYDSGTVKYYNGSAWISIGTSTGDITRVNITAGNGLSGDVDTTSGDHTQTIDLEAAQTVITSIYNTSLKLGRSSSTEYIDFATDNVIKLVANGGEARWNGSAFVPGSDGDKDLGSSSKEWNDLYIDGTANIDALAMGVTVTAINDEDDMSSDSATALATQQSIKAYVDSSVLSLIDEDDMSSDSATRPPSQQSVKAFVEGGAGFTAEKIQDVVGAMFTGNTETRITATYQDSDGTIDLVVNDMTANDNDDVSNANLLTALANLESTSGAANENIVIGTDSGDTIVITGNLQVSGTTTTVDSTTVTLNDHNIVLDSGNTTSAVVNGAGITLEGGTGDDATFTYNTTGPKFELKLGSSYEDLQVDQLIAASLDISGNVDVDGTLETDALTIDGKAIAEFVQDTVGAMFTGNTETRVSATYQDGDGTIDLVVDDMTANDVRTVTAGGNTLASNETLAFTAGSNITITESGGAVTIASTDTNTQLSFASTAEVKAGTNTTKAVNPRELARARSVVASIDVSDSTFASNLYAEITHSLNTEDVIVQLFDSSTKETVFADVARTDKDNNASTTKVKITFASAPSNDIEVLITSLKEASAGTVSYS